MATAARKPLRVVQPDEPADVKKLTVEQAAETGDARALLIAMRDRVAASISDPKCAPRDLSSLTLRLEGIVEKIAAHDLRAMEEGADAEDVAADETWTSEAL